MIQILEKIKEYDSIVILTHKRPDMDALGSQMGLKWILEENFPKKQIYASGEVNKFRFDYELDDVTNKTIKESLIIVLDSGSEHLISDQRHNDGSFLIKFDHHINNSPYGDICYVDESFESTCGMVTEFASSLTLIIPTKAAELLYAGMVTDSGRFLYSSVTPKTFALASLLINQGINIESIYNRIYKQSLKFKKLQGYVLSNFIAEDGIAYIKYDSSVMEKFNVTLAELKSGTVNQMANIEGIDVWATFTEHEDNIFLELRGSIDCLDIAVNHGGGGHKRACGATLKSWDEVEEVIKEMKELV